MAKDAIAFGLLTKNNNRGFIISSAPEARRALFESTEDQRCSEDVELGDRR
jgi:hypothetical protein